MSARHTALREYRRKRDFSVTPEPPGTSRAAEGRSFVVQKHAARSLHYDFRLELDGVLKSWAVPKGPSLDPSEKRLAVQTEDHPVEYGQFEGDIPQDEYGGGMVVIWDRGTWEPSGDPHEGYRSGRLKFQLRGEKLRGAFALVRIRSRDDRKDGRTWLLIKQKDVAARRRSSAAAAQPESEASGRRLEEVASEPERVQTESRSRSAAMRGARTGRSAQRESPGPSADPKHVSGSRRAALPDFVSPQLATLVTAPPAGSEWLHEIKIDGYRILGRVQNGRARLLSRRGNDWTARFSAIAKAMEGLPTRQALLDGEAAVLLSNGTTSFQALQNRMEGQGQLVYYAFDLLHLDGYDLTPAPLVSRKSLLRELVSGAGHGSILRYSDHVEGSGPEFYARACRMSLEGVVSKQGQAPYHSGRGHTWLKVKCVQEQEVVIGGYTEPQRSRVGLGALLLGIYDASGKLRYAGKVGTGFTQETLRDLKRRLTGLEQGDCPFADRPPQSARAHWVRPELVAQVAFSEWTSDGRLRHPSFQGLREDKAAREVVRESPEPVATTERQARPASRRPTAKRRASAETVEVAGVRLTHPDRVLYPSQGTTKHDLALYYASIADWILPQLEGRPTILVRCPEGAHKECFYQRHPGPWAPETLRRVEVRESKGVGQYLVVDDLPGLIGLVQIGILEIHTWNCKADRLEQPDRLVFDFDPAPSLPWPRVIEAAERLNARLEELDLASFVKTTGGKGLHVVVPLEPGSGWDELAAFARGVALDLERQEPDAYTTTMSKAKRRGKVFIDFMRNYRGASSVAAYSTRAREGAPVSAPLRWDELSAELRSDHFTLANLGKRLATLKADPWAGYGATRQRITPDHRKALGPA